MRQAAQRLEVLAVHGARDGELIDPRPVVVDMGEDFLRQLARRGVVYAQAHGGPPFGPHVGVGPSALVGGQGLGGDVDGREVVHRGVVAKLGHTGALQVELGPGGQCALVDTLDRGGQREGAQVGAGRQVEGDAVVADALHLIAPAVHVERVGDDEVGRGRIDGRDPGVAAVEAAKGVERAAAGGILHDGAFGRCGHGAGSGEHGAGGQGGETVRYGGRAQQGQGQGE